MFIVSLFFFLLVGVAPTAAELRLASGQGVELLAAGWEYRADDGLWRPLEISHERPDGVEGDEIRCRVLLPPAADGRDPALLLGYAFLSIEAYVGDELLYRSGTFGPQRANRYLGLKTHIIPLPPESGGRWLLLRFHSSYGDIGLHAPPYIGQRADLVRAMLRADLGRMCLACVLMVIGFFGLYVFVRRRDAAALAFAGLALGVGVYTLGFAEARQLVWDRPVFWWYVGCLAFLAFPIGMWAFYERVIGGRGRVLVRRLWQVHAIYLVGALAFDLVDVVPLPWATQPFLFLLVTGMALSGLAGRYTGADEDPEQAREIRILRGAMNVMMLFGLHDILTGFHLVDTGIYVFHIGVFLLVLVLAYILERRFVTAQMRLESQSERLTQANSTLETRVEARTRDLIRKNSELAGAKDQLVMQEKMASLGNLVAGVAHEVNNPIGAINSAVDVVQRCIARLRPAVHGQEKVVGLLEDNVRTISTAGGRVAEIVRNLKDFARLDQAERQLANLHEGLDSTLDLVGHLYKNRIAVVRRYGELTLVDCRPGQINQVFMNMLVNAAQAIEGQGTVLVESWSEKGFVCVRISDDGRGIAADDLGRIFDPGFTTKGVGVGTGLGLSISYRIIAEHGGEIVAGAASGGGATFTVRLPLGPAIASEGSD
jgi:signal transduction histidine kinase